MKLLSYLACLCAVGGLVLGVLALVLNRRAPTNRDAAAAAFAYVLWALGMTFAYGSDDASAAVVAYRLSFLGSLFIAPSVVALYLRLAGASPRLRRWWVGLSFAYSTALLIHYWVSGFYYGSFVDGPWGNIGVPSEHWFWATVNPLVQTGEILAAVGVLVFKARRGSERLRRQVRVLVPAMVLAMAANLLSWLSEAQWGLPNAQVLSGIVFLVANFILIARYRYLLPDRPLLEKHLFERTQESVFLLDVNRRVAGANGSALSRLGASEGDLVGKDFRDLFEETTMLDLEWERVVGGQALHSGQLATLGGSTVILTLSPRFDSFRDLVGVVALVGDLPDFDEKTERFGITAREKQVLLLSLQEANFAEIADALGISPATVKNHLHKLCEKTVSANRVELFGKLLAGAP